MGVCDQQNVNRTERIYGLEGKGSVYENNKIFV